MVKPDLQRVGIPYQDASGRYADFHSLRVTFITNLAKAGVHPRVAQGLARHSTMELTMQVYTHVALDSKQSAIRGLPDLESTPERKQACDEMTGRSRLRPRLDVGRPWQAR